MTGGGAMPPEGGPRNIDPQSDSVSMKPLLSVAVKEAVHLALIDSVAPPQDEKHPYGIWTDAEREAFLHDEYAIPAEALAGMDVGALAQNVCCRLLGTGGWMVNGVYAGNATPREVLDASLERPDRDHIAEIAFDMGLQPHDEDGEADRVS